MGRPVGAKYQIAKSLTVNTSLITSNPWYTGDFKLLQVSCSTQSNAAINVQGHNGDGFQAPLAEAEWFNVLALSRNSVWAISPIPYWSRTSSPASSNGTIIFMGLP